MRLLILVLLLFSAGVRAASDCEMRTTAEIPECLQSNGWRHAFDDRGTRVYTRHLLNTDRYELFMVARLDAQASRVYATLADYDAYTGYMPETLSCSRVMKAEDGRKLVWQQIDFNPLLNLVVDDQHYLIDIVEESGDDGEGWYRISWSQASGEQYAGHTSTDRRCSKGRRIRANDGYWEIEQRADGQADIKYYLYTQPSGWAVEKLARTVAKVTRKEAPATIEALKNRLR